MAMAEEEDAKEMVVLFRAAAEKDESLVLMDEDPLERSSTNARLVNPKLNDWDSTSPLPTLALALAWTLLFSHHVGSIC